MKYTRKGENAKRKMRKNKSRVTRKKGGANLLRRDPHTTGIVDVLNEKYLLIKNLKAKIADLEEKIKESQESEKQSEGIIKQYEVECNQLREENRKLREENRKLPGKDAR